MNETQHTAGQAFGLRLAQERRHKALVEARDIGQKDVAAAAGVSESTVSRWEAGEVMPRDAALARLAKYFGVTVPWLRYGVEPRQAQAVKSTVEAVPTAAPAPATAPEVDLHPIEIEIPTAAPSRDDLAAKRDRTGTSGRGPSGNSARDKKTSPRGRRR